MDDPASNTPSWRLKFDRASGYLDELTEAFKRLVESKQYQVGTAVDASTGAHQFTFGDKGPAPIGWSLIVGDLVQNLRASLDHAVWQLTPEVEHREHPRRPEFPICLNPADFKDGGVRATKTLADEVRAAIEGLQPYRTHEQSPMDSPLWWLSELSAIDKHRRIHLIGAVVQFRGLKISQPGQPDVVIGEIAPPPGAIGRAHQAIASTIPEGTPPEQQIDLNFSAAVMVLFQDAGAVTGRRAISTLGEIREAVHDALKVLESFVT